MTPTNRKAAGDALRAWPDHLGLIVATLGFLLVAIRVLGFARFDALTAKAIIQAGGSANVAITIAISSLPLVVGLAYGVFTGAVGSALLEKGHLHKRLWSAWAIFTFVSALVLPWVLSALAALLMGVTWLRARRKGNAKSPATPADEDTGGWKDLAWPATLVGLILVTALSVEPYLPSESLAQGEKPTITGYVLAESEDELTVLTDESRQVERIPTDQVERKICSESDPTWWLQSLPQWLADDRYEQCPER